MAIFGEQHFSLWAKQCCRLRDFQMSEMLGWFSDGMSVWVCVCEGVWVCGHVCGGCAYVCVCFGNMSFHFRILLGCCCSRRRNKSDALMKSFLGMSLAWWLKENLWQLENRRIHSVDIHLEKQWGWGAGNNPGCKMQLEVLWTVNKCDARMATVSTTLLLGSFGSALQSFRYLTCRGLSWPWLQAGREHAPPSGLRPGIWSYLGEILHYFPNLILTGGVNLQVMKLRMSRAESVDQTKNLLPSRVAQQPVLSVHSCLNNLFYLIIPSSLEDDQNRFSPRELTNELMVTAFTARERLTAHLSQHAATPDKTLVIQPLLQITMLMWLFLRSCSAVIK